MSLHQFIAKWKVVDLKESVTWREHFIDLCRMLGQPTPIEADPTGTWSTFEAFFATAS